MVSPSMREVPLAYSADVVKFASELITGHVDLAIFMTGVGVRHLMAIVQRHVDQQRFLDSLADITTVARGPKPVAALRELGLKPTWTVPEPNTWRELLALLDQHGSLANQTVALQEYGVRNASLIAGLEARGARLLNLQVYQWDLPVDIGPLRDNVQRLANAEADVVLFTSAQQVQHLLRVAEEQQVVAAVRAGLRQAVIASVGPSTSEMLRQCDLPVDLEPSHPKLGHLIVEAAERAHGLLARKQRVQRTLASVRARTIDTAARWHDGPFLTACRGEPTTVTPVWLMRQAGRYMEEYRRVRAQVGFLELCKNPQLCSEVMVTAVTKLGVDAAIIFSDLLPILEPMGLHLEYAHGDGPVIHNPVREAGDVERVIELDSVDALDFVIETVRQTRQDLPAHLPLIGFAGAPFTLASYIIEGGSSRNYLHTKTLMYRDAGAWRELMQRISRSVALYLNAQIAAGAQCVQLFDSWVGCLGPADYRQYVLPFVTQIVRELVPGVPVINFATGNPALLPLLAEAGAAVIGIDWRIDLDEAWRRVGMTRAVQGNLDPCALLADRAQIERRAQDVLDRAGGRPGHIFNLGHGILKETPVENVVALVDYVHSASQR
jgi:uroporphyrinogen decarboxylase